MSFGQINGSPINYHSINGSGLETANASALVYTQQDAVTIFSGSSSLAGMSSFAQEQSIAFAGSLVMSGFLIQNQDAQNQVFIGKPIVSGKAIDGNEQESDEVNGAFARFLNPKNIGQPLSAHQQGAGLNPHGRGSSLKVH